MKSAKTRLGFTGLVVCGAAVLVWGAADLYAWATTGQEVLAAYGEPAPWESSLWGRPPEERACGG